MLNAVDSRLLDAALSYANRGWRVFPCHSPNEQGDCSCGNRDCANTGKHPRTLHGLKDATTDRQQIEAWWQKSPDANIGVATGEQSGFFVIDVDGAAGRLSLEQLIQQHGGLPSTYTVKTGSGLHLYYQHPAGIVIRNSAGKLGEKIDVRANGGYVIAPPSRHALGNQYQRTGGYEMVSVAPEWLVELVKDKPVLLSEPRPIISPQTQYEQYANTALGLACREVRTAVEGARNDTLNREAFSVGQLIGAKVIGRYKVEGALLDAALAVGLTETEAKRTIQSGLNEGILKPRDMSQVGVSRHGDTSTTAEIEWRYPKALPKGLPPVELFDYALLPEAFQSWVRDIAERLQCPPDFPAVAAMIVSSSLLGRKVGIRPKAKDSWLVIANLWGVCVGRPSLKKTPALKEFTKLLERLEVETSKQHDSAVKGWQTEAMIREEREKLLKSDIKKAIKNDEDPQQFAEAILQEQATSPPVRKRYIVNDATVEKLGELLAENPNGLLVNRDELSGFLMSLEKTGHECDRAFYLETWNGDGRFTYDRIGRGTVEIESACLSIIGNIQPGPLSRYLRDALTGGKGDDGFIQRFQMMVYPDSPKTFENIDRYPDTQAKNKAYEAISRLNGLTPESVGAIPEEFDTIPTLRFMPDAQQDFNEWLVDLENRLLRQEEHAALEAHLAKYRSLVPSLALLFHLIDGGVGSVSSEALQRACAWSEYLESHARRIYGTGLASDVYLAESLLAQIKKGKLPSPFTVRDVQRHNWSGLTTNQDVRVALDVLEEADILYPITTETKGRPREDYYINPAIAQDRGQCNG